MPDVSAVLQGGGDSGGLTAVPSVDDSPDGGVSAVRGENKLVAFKESDTWEVVVVLSMHEETRVKAEVESLYEVAFNV